MRMVIYCKRHELLPTVTVVCRLYIDIQLQLLAVQLCTVHTGPLSRVRASTDRVCRAVIRTAHWGLRLAHSSLEVGD